LRAAPHLHDLAGHLAESIVGYFLGTIPGLDLAWFPERGAEPEVDFVLTVGEHRIPLEVKYRLRIDEHRDTLGLRAFLEKTVYNAPFGILITLADNVIVHDPRIITLPLSSLLLMR
jgi:predicted AAA+ superfamily ATPase